MSREFFLAKYGTEKHLDEVFAGEDAGAQYHALSYNKNVTRKHVLIGHKSDSPFVRLAAFKHILTTDKELVAARKNDINTSNKYEYDCEINHRKWIRDGTIRPSVGDRHWPYYLQHHPEAAV